MVEGLGLLRAATLLLPEQILFDDEIYHTHRVLAKGIGTNADQLALDVIKSVGPGGHFMSQKHTRRTIRDLWIPELTHPPPNLDPHLQSNIRERAKSKFRQILKDHQPEPLAEDVQAELSSIIEAAERLDS